VGREEEAKAVRMGQSHISAIEHHRHPYFRLLQHSYYLLQTESLPLHAISPFRFCRRLTFHLVQEYRGPSLLGISKRGNWYLRRLFIQGARADLQQRTKQTSGLSAWLDQLAARTHPNAAAVALANKLARIAWAVLAREEPYRPPELASMATA